MSFFHCRHPLICRRARWRSLLLQAFSISINFCLFVGLTLTSEAGDILRGGMVSGPPAAGGSRVPTAGTTLPTGANPNDSLARTAQALQAVQAMQSAARNLARTRPPNLGLDPNHPGQLLPNVPNGLTVGGLQVAPGVPVDLAHPKPDESPALWTGAALPTCSNSNGLTNVNIKQTAQQALLNWQTFNVGKETNVNFDQTAGGANASQWIAFNTINDPSGIPSQILGSISALGQIYLINQNGIIFGGSSQVNLHSLVASSLPINTNLVTRGLLNNPDDQFLFSSLAIPILPNGGTMPAFNPPPPPNTPDGRLGDITVQKGATLSSPTTPDHVGGRIALLGPNVTNDGTISTPDGQTNLAAGQQVGFTAHATTDPSLRGLDVFVGAVDDLSGTATNSGLIEAPRADVTMIGKAVDQLGFIDSSTSVALNGRIDLLANYNTVVPVVLGAPHFNPSASGTVTLGEGSVTQILPELSSTETVVGTQLALPSQVNIQGEAIHLANDALLVAPSAAVSLNAGTWLTYPSGFLFTSSEGQIYLDSNAIIDVSGSRDVTASVTDNIIPVQLLGPELANSPLQRNGPLRGQTIEVDIRQHGPYDPTLNNGQGGYTWIGTPLADTSGYVNLVQRSVGELTTAGGSVNLTAGESVIMQPGSRVDVSGGWIDYEGGLVSTTQVISNGHILDISQATPDRLYSGIYGSFPVDHPKWGITETMSNPLGNSSHFEASYVQGGNGGTVTVSAPAVALDGSVLGNTVLGPRQQASAPVPSALSLTFQAQQPISPLFQELSPTPPDLTFNTISTLQPADPFALDSLGKPIALRSDRQDAVVLSPDLVNKDGFGTIAINNSDGDITVPAGVTLDAGANGSITLLGANVDIEGHLATAGGNINLAAYDFSPFELAILKITPGAETPPADSTRGNFTLGSAASITTAGLIIDERQGAASDTVPLVTNGGSVSIAGYNTSLRSGSAINVSGGVAVDMNSKQTFGNAGSITITGGQDPNVASILGGHLSLGATLTGYSGTQVGGSLSVLAPLIQLGGKSANADTSVFQPAFFSRGGFSNFTLTGLGARGEQPDQYIPGVLVSSGTVIAPVVQSWVANLDTNPLQLTPLLAPQALRPTVSIDLASPGVRDTFNGDRLSRGDVIVSSGSSLLPGPKGSVTLAGDTVTVLGSITAPGGAITVSGASNAGLLFTDQSNAVATVDLAPGSILSVAGQTLLTPNPFGFRTGSVLPGGTITVSGNIVAESGALLDVSGTSDVLDLAPEFSDMTAGTDPTAPRVTPITVESNAGTITFSGGQELFVDATLVGAAGGSSALGGNLILSSGRFYPPGTANPPTPLDITMVVTQDGPTIPTQFYLPGTTAIGHTVVNPDGSVVDGLGHFAASTLDNHTFDSLTLKGTVDFSGPVTLATNRKLVVGTGGVIFGDDAINLDAPYVSIGSAFQPPVSPLIVVPPFTVAGQPFYFPPTIGPGALNINAKLIDVGNLSLQNISVANFVAENGDIRGDGTLDVAGSISMTAGQIYPPTEVTFTIAAFNYLIDGITYPGSINVNAGGNRPIPLSGGGELNLYATIINQNGVLRAPLGSINVGDGVKDAPPIDPISNQPFAATQQLTFGPASVTSVSTVDPATGQSLVIPYGYNLNGTSWIDPAGVDITAGGVPSKQINVSAVSIDDQSGSSFDISGGGDLYTYRFVSGVGGTNDILASSGSFAVIPGYQFDYAPIDPIYANTSLSVGDQVFLNAGSGLAAGTYTLLPARYALLPGAFLVTPKTGTPPTSVLQPDGSSVVAGYRFNDLNPNGSGQPASSLFEVAPQLVVQSRATYDNYSANTFLLAGAQTRDLPIPRLPIDSGELVLAATNSLTIHGNVASQAPTGGAGGRIDISSPSDILISPFGGGPGILRLDPIELSNFNADSLLIGGFRQPTSIETNVTVTTSNLTVDNSGAALTGPEVILVANQSLTLAPGADIEQKGILASPAEILSIGNDDTAGSGDGVLLRVSSDPLAGIVRAGVSSSAVPTFLIGGNARIIGQSIIVDSTNAMLLDSAARLIGNTVALDSGQISLVLSNPGELNPTTGLVLSGPAFENLAASAQSLSLLSYSSFDIYGIGEVGALDDAGEPAVASFALHAAEIRGFNNSGGIVSFVARNLQLDNSPNGTVLGSSAGPLGTLQFVADTIELGENPMAIDQFAKVTLAASSGVLLQDSGGLSTQGDLTILTPLVTGATGANQTISAAGNLSTLYSSRVGSTPLENGLGASLTLQGANVTVSSNLTLPSGTVNLHATDGNVLVDGNIDVRGTAQSFFDLTNYTNGGEVTLTSDLGYVLLPPGSTINVSAQPGGGDAGTIAIAAPNRNFFAGGALLGQAGANGHAGAFSLDTGLLATLASLDAYLDAGSFSLSRSIRVRSGDVVIDGTATVDSFNLSADAGSITVTGIINASGVTGGSIDLEASGDLSLSAGSLLTVAGQQLNAAGSGGTIFLETTHGTLTLNAGSTIDLFVGNGPGGSLHLRAPQTNNGTDVAINPIAGAILSPGSIVAEGFFAQDANNSGVAVIDDFEDAALANAQAFEANASAIQARLLSINPSFAGALHIRPGEEIDNSQGDLVLNADWDLSTWRFGERKPVVDNAGSFLYDLYGNQIFAGVEPGILTLRAKGSITLNGSLQDGFGDSGGEIDIPIDDFGNPAPWKEGLLPRFQDGTTQESWAFRITTGADFAAADFRRVQPLSALGPDSGSLLIGVDGGTNIANPPGPDANSDSALEGHYQVIRTGTGDIDISVGRDVALLNQFATIYTAGSQVGDPTLGGTFDTPRLFSDPDGFFPAYPAQYSFGGGNVTIFAQNDILHETRGPDGSLIPDSERELPTSWLYRRGYVDPSTGEYGVALFGDVASTSWWIDFSTFFAGVGALGGGNVTLKAGHDISNVDAVVPTNARAPIGTPDPNAIVELGGGNLLVQAGHDIDGGVYYVERGTGTLQAGDTIHTNSTRSPSLTIITNEDPYPEQTWLPTTLFLGKGSFDVAATNDVLLGPTANPFLLPQGLGNTYWYKTYFSTYAPTSSVSASSLAGSVTVRESTTLPITGQGGSTSSLLDWYQKELLLTQSSDTVAFYQPWLRVAETLVSPFKTETELFAPVLQITSFSGDINFSGNVNLFPSATGTLDLAARGSINALQPNGVTTIDDTATNAWAASTINLSDADPSSVPGIASPFAYQAVVGTNTALAKTTGTDFLTFIDTIFTESGSTQGTFGVLQTKQALHAQGLLHFNDLAPAHVYATEGDISGLTLFSPKVTKVAAGNDLTDIAFYIQNDRSTDITVVAAGRDIIAYDPTSSLRSQAQASGNALDFGEVPLAGDIQISGPGTLEVLAGRDLNLGIGPNNPDGTALGVTSIGNERNPSLPFAGASIVAGAGIGVASGLANSALHFDDFVAQFIDPNSAPTEAARYLPEIGPLVGLDGASNADIWAKFVSLPFEQQEQIALDVFYFVLRDAGREHNDPESPGFNNFDASNAAIAALFPGDDWNGDISLTSREIKTNNGGDINLFAPGGAVTVGFDAGQNQAADQGILTEHGGNIYIFAQDSVTLGTSRIFTLRGGDEIIYSALGDIAAGVSSKTVQAAPPTRVLIDPQSADVQTDLAGLATGGGIGVLESVAGVPPGDVDLVAPTGTVDAGDAGIRVSGNLNISAVLVLNAGNIQVGGTSIGTPVVSAPNIGNLTAASNTVGATSNAAAEASRQARADNSQSDLASIVTVEVLGYGGGDDSGSDDPAERRKKG